MGFQIKIQSWRKFVKEESSSSCKGILQREGDDFEEVFFPATRMETIHLFMAIAAQNEWSIYQLNVKSTFLNGELKEEVFVS